MLRGFATINHWADDVEAAKRWYAELLGVEPYFERSGPDSRLAYAEFRIGDAQDELGLVDRPGRHQARGPSRAGRSCTGTSTTSATYERLLSMGAKEYQPITPRGESGS